jgi:hypothetical protein
MISPWQWAGIIVLVLLMVGLGIYTQPNSYAHLYLTGKCFHEPMPAACHPRGRRG